MRSSPRPIMTKRCSAQSAWTMASSSRSVTTRRCSAPSTYRWWRRLRDMSWPDDVHCVVHVVYDFFSNVNHDQTMFFVVYVDYRRCPPGLSWTDDVFRSLCELLCDFISKVNHERTMFCAVHVDFVLVCEVHDQTMFSSSWLMWTMSLSTMLIMIRRPDHTVLADQMTPMRIIGSTLSKKNSK